MSITCVGGRLGGTGLGAIAILLLNAGGQPLLAQQPNTAATPAVTFARDVAPILQKSCQECHRPGAVGPMALRTFEEVRPWARAIKLRVVEREMPPYRYDKVGIQHLKGDLRLSDADIQTIVRWVDTGAPLGNVADLPPPVQFPDGYEVGVRGRARSAGSHRPDQAVHASGRGTGSLVAADRPRRNDGRSLHQGARRQAVVEGARRRPSRQQRPDGPRSEDRAVRRARARLRIRVRQGRRDRAAGWLPDAAGELDDQVGRPLLAVWRRGQGRRRRARHLALPARITRTRRSTSRISSCTRC